MDALVSRKSPLRLQRSLFICVTFVLPADVTSGFIAAVLLDVGSSPLLKGERANAVSHNRKQPAFNQQSFVTDSGKSLCAVIHQPFRSLKCHVTVKQTDAGIHVHV